MRGGIDHQVTHIFNHSGILQIDKSKHEAKEEARLGGASTWHEIGKELGIYSYGTADTYKDVWHEFARFAKAEMGLKDIEKTDSTHLREFLSHKIDDGIARTTYRKISAAMEKFESALNRFSKKVGKDNIYDFHVVIKELSKTARMELEINEVARAYLNPMDVISALESEAHQLTAQIQHQGGARISEALLIKEKQLKGIKDGVGCIFLNFTKGGKNRNITVNADTYKKLEAAVKKGGGEFKVEKGRYRKELRNASEKTDQPYQGSHGLRWSFAQERMEYLQENGHTHEQSLTMVSNEMGHNRADITNHYLKK